MENCYGQHGWKEFNSNRKDILSELDRILERIKSRRVQVAHGPAVEAYLRKWLSEFLPKKYGVTSGYIISSLYDENSTLNHFDIIIYNQLESPILWTEGNSDQSEQGKFRAIPAKYVMAVYEVKAKLTKKNVTEALKKLNQTKSVDSQLNPLYSCGMIFVDLKEAENNSESIIKELIKAKDIHGFRGGVILRYEGDQTSTGRITLFDTDPNNIIDHKHYKPISKPIDSLNIYLNEDGSLALAEQGAGAKFVKTSNDNFSVSKTYHVLYSEDGKNVKITWSRTNFSDFCIDLISSLEGIAPSNNDSPSFGQVFDKIERRNAPLQSQRPSSGSPFLVLGLHEESANRNNPKIKSGLLTFFVSIQNIGEVSAIISDDSFKTTFELQSGKTVVKTVNLQLQAESSKNIFTDFPKFEPFIFCYRIVYRPTSSKHDFSAIEMALDISYNKICLAKN